MRKHNVHVVKGAPGRSVKVEKIPVPLASYQTQDAAIKAGIEYARSTQAELRIHGRDGKIREARSYGNDPCPPKDRA